MEEAARVLIVVLLAVAGITVEGGREKRMPLCIGDLSPCLPAITDPVVKLLPGSDCCVAVKNALRREKECLCSLFNTSSSPSSFFSFFGPTFPIPSVCGISLADISKCDDAYLDSCSNETETTTATAEGCCKAVRKLVVDVTCFCTIMREENATMGDIQPIEQKCNVTIDTSICSSAPKPAPSPPTNSTSDPPPSSPTNSSSTSKPPQSSPTNSSSSQKKEAFRVTWSMKPKWAVGLILLCIITTIIPVK